MPHYNFSQLTETVLSTNVSANRLCDIVKSLEAKIMEINGFSQELHERSDNQVCNISNPSASLASRLVESVPAAPIRYIAPSVSIDEESESSSQRPSNSLRYSKCLQVLIPTLAVNAADSVEEAGKKKGLISEHIKVLKSYAGAFYADLRMELFKSLGHIPVWSAMDNGIKSKYASLLEKFAKLSGYEIDKCQNKWLAMMALLLEQSHNDTKNRHNPKPRKKGNQTANDEAGEEQDTVEGTGSLSLSDQEEDQGSECAQQTPTADTTIQGRGDSDQPLTDAEEEEPPLFRGENSQQATFIPESSTVAATTTTSTRKRSVRQKKQKR